MTCDPAAADLVIRQGNNQPPGVWQFLTSEDPDVLFDITGSIFKLTIYWRGTAIELSSDTDAELEIDTPNSILTWNYSIETSRLLPVGNIARYELERWLNGSQHSWIEGSILVKEGHNVD